MPRLPRVNLKRAALAGVVILTLVFFLYVLLVIPEWQVSHLRMYVSEAEVSRLENEYRKTLTQIIGGAFVIIGVYLGWRRVAAAEKTVAVSQEEQITERFTRAIDQLGSEKIEVRLGGIYALERIAQESEKDHWPIMEVLTAYVRTRSPRKPGSTPEATPPDAQQAQAEAALPKLPVDIQAVLTVIGRRNATHPEAGLLDLSDTDLRAADLTEGRFEKAVFMGSDLSNAWMTYANFKGVNFESAKMSGAILSESELTGASFIQTDLRGARFYSTRLNDSQFYDADLSDANFGAAILKEAAFLMTNLNGTYFYGADLERAAFLDCANLTADQIQRASNLTGVETAPNILAAEKAKTK